MEAVGIVAAIALCAGVGLTAFDHLLTLTVGTSDRNEDHRISFQDKGVPWHTSQFKYRSVTLPKHRHPLKLILRLRGVVSLTVF
jgi:hypothetical protein